MNIVTPDIGVIFWQSLTFLMVLGILSKYAWKPILKIIREREEGVAHALYQISQAEALIKETRNERIKLLEEVALERERIITEALDAKREIIKRAHQEAAANQANILEQTRREIAQEAERTTEMLKRNLGLLAIQTAEKLLLKELSQHQAQIEFMERLTNKKSPLIL